MVIGGWRRAAAAQESCRDDRLAARRARKTWRLAKEPCRPGAVSVQSSSKKNNGLVETRTVVWDSSRSWRDVGTGTMVDGRKGAWSDRRGTLEERGWEREEAHFTWRGKG